MHVLSIYKFSRVTVIRHHKLGGFKQQKCILSQFQRLEVQAQGVGWPMLLLKVLRDSLSLCLPTSSGCWKSLAFFICSSITQSLPLSSHDHLLPVCISRSPKLSLSFFNLFTFNWRIIAFLFSKKNKCLFWTVVPLSCSARHPASSLLHTGSSLHHAGSSVVVARVLQSMGTM